MNRAAVRRQRGNNAARWLAEFYQERGWPHAVATGSGRNGTDVTGMAGLSCEVKATEEMRLESWLAAAEERPGVPYAVWMPPGRGRAALRSWPAIMRAAQVEALLDMSGLNLITEWHDVWADHVDVAAWATEAHRHYPRPLVMRYHGRGANGTPDGQRPAIMTVGSHTDVLAAAGYGGEASDTR